MNFKFKIHLKFLFQNIMNAFKKFFDYLMTMNNKVYKIYIVINVKKN